MTPKRTYSRRPGVMLFNTRQRPLFIGRKPCLPSAPLFSCFSEGDTCLDALLCMPLADPEEAQSRVAIQWPHGEGLDGVSANRSYMLTDERNWRFGLHGGGRFVYEGSVDKHIFEPRETTTEHETEGGE